MTALPVPTIDWSALWHDAGHHSLCQAAACPAAGKSHPEFDAAMDWSIDQLGAAGYRPDEDDSDDVDTASAYLTLAAIRCPALMR